MKKLISLSIIILLVSGCAAIVPKLYKPIMNSRTYEVSYDEAWEVIPKAFTSSGEVVAVSQKDSGLFSFKKYLEAEEFEKLALAPKKVYFLDRPVLEVNVVTTKVDDKHVTVTINSHISGSFKKDFTTWCASKVNSNGITENNYLDKIQALLNKGEGSNP